MYNFKKSISIDEQLLSEFLSAIGTFAQQTFEAGLQAIQIQNRQKMNFYVDSKSELIFVAISDDRDNNALLENLLAETALRFNDSMGKFLNSSERSCIDNYREFDFTFIQILKGKDKPRNRHTMIKGIFTGLAILTLIMYAFSPLFIQFTNNPTIYLALLILFISVGSFVSAFISGYFAGNPKMGQKNGIGFFLFILLVVLIFYPYSFIIWLIASPFAIIICAAGGFYGGLS